MTTPIRTGEWIAHGQEILQKIVEREGESISQAAQWCADSIAADGVVHLFGTGHSRIAIEEMFPRYGSFPGFNPIGELSMTFHTEVVGANGQRQAMFIERVEGLAEQILNNFQFAPQDLMIVFSAGGQTAVPIEMARGARARGIKVIAVTSVASQKHQPTPHSSRTSLYENADLVIDLNTPIGDALITIEGLKTPVGPGSSLSVVAIVNEIKVQTARHLLSRGIEPLVLTSSSIVGKEENKRLFEAAYAEHARRISSRLAGAPSTGEESGGR